MALAVVGDGNGVVFNLKQSVFGGLFLFSLFLREERRRVQEERVREKRKEI